MKVLSWNVNGIRAAARKGFRNWLDQCDGTFVGLQEVRALPEQIPKDLQDPEGWHKHIVAGERKGYSGVGFYSRMEPDHVETSMGVEEFDREGRIHILTFGSLRIANVYFPNGNGKNRDNSRVPYKLAFYERLYEMLHDDFKAGRPLLVIGDFNTAHQAIDLARPKQNRETSGFLLVERQEFSRWTSSGWVDTFRHYHPDEPDHYTWWRQWGGARENNVGWRIDYILASPGAMPFVQDGFILPEDMGSDHCPIGIEIDEAVLTA